MPPSPEQMPVPANSAPIDKDNFASSDNAPKLISETNNGIFKMSGFLALGPITSSLLTATSSNKGLRAICAVII